MENDYFLVIWTKEQPVRFSVMSRLDITDDTARNISCQELLDQEVKFKWNKKNLSCVGKILDSGTKMEMENNMNLRVKEAKEKSKESVPLSQKIKKISNLNKITLKRKGNINSVLQQVSRDDEKDVKIRKLTQDLELERSKNAEIEAKYEDLKAEFESSKSTARKSDAGVVDIGDGILLPREFLTTIKSVSSSMNIYARNLFKHLFESHELVGYSLMGKGCNANKTSKQPSIDPIRRDALIEHSLAVYNKTSGTEAYNLAKKDLKKSLACLIVEISKCSKELEAQAVSVDSD